MKRLKFGNLMMTLAAILGGMVMTRAAEGALIRHTFSGEINFVVGGPPPGPWEGAGLGSIWELSYVFDTEMPDEDPGNSMRGLYTIDNGSISMDGVELFAVFGEFEVLDGVLGFDEFRVRLFGTSLGGGGVGLGAPPGTLVSDSIPFDFNLADWSFLQYEGGDAETFFFRGSVLSFTSEIVPGPGGGLLILLSSIVMGGKKRRRIPV